MANEHALVSGREQSSKIGWMILVKGNDGIVLHVCNLAFIPKKNVNTTFQNIE